MTTNPNQGFIQHLNPMTGRDEWRLAPEDYDYQQEVARAAFADMLHDSERNRLYYRGLESAISHLKAEGRRVHVLDIGTGTGLLSMMAAALGADSVTAIEEFKPMERCAKKVISLNGFADKIRVIGKRSTGVKVGPGLDMEMKANVLVTEVFDTELIGEGAIGTFNHAHKALLAPDCLVVPCKAVMYAQVVHSDLASNWNRLKSRIDLKNGHGKSIILRSSESGSKSSSSSLALHDIQLSQFKPEWFEPLSPPAPIFHFDFSGRTGPIAAKRESITRFNSKAGEMSADAIFVWWELEMNPVAKTGSINLSCAPHWAHPDGRGQPWRDHWMQSVYFPVSGSVSASVNSNHLALISNHDEYSLWFDVRSGEKPDEEIGGVPMPGFTEGESDDDDDLFHSVVNRQRIGQLNSDSRNDILIAATEKMLNRGNPEEKRPNCLALGDQSLLPLIAAKSENSGRIFVPADRSRHVTESLKKIVRDLNPDIADKVTFSGKSAEEILRGGEIDLILAEPHFSLSYLPWHNLRFWFSVRDNPNRSRVMPCAAEIWAVPVRYRDLWKIRRPLNRVEGFEMRPFDDIIMKACETSDENVEPHSLWEYPAVACANPVRLIRFDLTENPPERNVAETREFQTEFEGANGKFI